MKTLVIFCKGFPYGTSEPFLEGELPCAVNFFEKIVIVSPKYKGQVQTRSINGAQIELVTVDLTSFASSLKTVLAALFQGDFWQAVISEIRNEHCLSFERIRVLVSLIGRGQLLAEAAKKWETKNPDCAIAAIYAYWLNTPAYAAIKYKKTSSFNPKAVSRAHRYDLYNFQPRFCHLCMQKAIIEKLDEVYSISEDGRAYLSREYPSCASKIFISRLGAVDKGIINPYSSRSVFRIVSCSRVVPVKRLGLLVQALSKIERCCIEWTHLGDGPEMSKIKQMVNDLPSNIHVKLLGTLSNEQVYSTYQTEEFHLFVNVSESEGIPVSVMEAMSFGIPQIATDVGGVRELVGGFSGGKLLPKDFEIQDLSAAIEQVAGLSEGAYASMRSRAREFYKEEYCAETNYREFQIKLSGGGK